MSDDASTGDALGKVLALVAGTNAALAAPMDGDKLKRLREWLEKAMEVLMSVARKLAEHGNVSLNVGVTGLMVSASVTVGLS